MKEFTNETDNNRYSIVIDGSLAAVLDYRVNGDVVSFTRSFTTPALRGRGLAAELVEFAANDVEANSTRRIIPMCWYVGEWFDAHPDRAGLLTRGAAAQQ